jgi:hypothetical protein
MANNFMKNLRTVVDICKIFAVLQLKAGAQQINITVPIDLHIQFVIAPGIGAFLDSWLLFQRIISAFLP